MISNAARVILGLFVAIWAATTAQAVTLKNGDILVIHNNANPITAGVVRIDLTTGILDVVSGAFPGFPLVGTGLEFVKLHGIAVESSGHIIVADFGAGANRLIRIDPSTGNRMVVTGCGDNTCSFLIGGGPPFLGAVGDPRVEADGSILVIDERAFNQTTLFRVDPVTGDRTVVSGCGDSICSFLIGDGFVGLAQAMELEQDGNILVFGRQFFILHRVDPVSGSRTTVSRSSELAAPSDTVGDGVDFGRTRALAVEANGDILAATPAPAGATDPVIGIIRVDPVTGDRTLVSGCNVSLAPVTCVSFVGTGPMFGGPGGVAVEANGDILATEPLGTIFRVDPSDGARTNVFSLNAASVRFTDLAVFRSLGSSPVADAGPDQTVRPGTLVTLDGSASTDPDGDVPLAFAWEITSKPGGSLAELSDPTAVFPSFTADLLGDYTIQLVVTDSLGNSSPPDSVVISTFNTAPVADAGLDQAIIAIGSIVQLDGSQSFDDDGDGISYAWTIQSKPDGSLALLDDPTRVNPTFEADIHGDYVASLVVTDTFGAASSPDTVTISFDNVKPVADAGVNQSVLIADTVLLDGSGSSDANLDPLSFNWGITAQPMGSLATLDDPTLVQPSFIADEGGTYAVSLVVNDGFIDSDPFSVTIVAVTRQDAAINGLQDTIDAVNSGSLAPEDFKNKNLRNALTNKINAALDEIDQGFLEDALNKLKNDVLAKTDGCVVMGAPDRNDWLTTCAAQALVYPLVVDVIAILESA